MSPRPAPNDSDPFRRLVAIMERLLDADGCPWDREQNHESLKPYVIEEAYEVCEAIDKNSMTDLKEELGDLALQVVFHAALARREKKFSIDDVFDGICAKLIRRHPHVFADVEVDGSVQVLKNWEQIKQEEKREKAEARRREREERAKAPGVPVLDSDSLSASQTDSPSPSTDADASFRTPHSAFRTPSHGLVDDEPVPSVLDGVPRAMPALTRATRVQEKAARVGFDWDKIDDVWKKVEEEVGEFREAAESKDPKKMLDEFGDFLFALVNLGRFLDIHPEEALQGTTNKFIRRFRHIEKRVHEDKRNLKDMTLAQMDALWNEAKGLERK